MPSVSNILDEQNIKGTLPDGCMTWVNANKKRLKCGLEIVQPAAEVTMVLLNAKGEVVHTFADETLYLNLAGYGTMLMTGTNYWVYPVYDFPIPPVYYAINNYLEFVTLDMSAA